MPAAADLAAEAAVAALEEACKGEFVQLGGVKLKGVEAADITPAWILQNTKHLLLKKEVLQVASERCGELLERENEHEGGDTSLGNEIILRSLVPGAARAAAAVKKGDVRGAFAELVGLFLYCKNADRWLVDNEVYMESKVWKKLFTQLGDAWRACLARPPADLGIATPEGPAYAAVPAECGSLPRLKNMLGKWERSVNRLLREQYDGHNEGGKPARLRIFSSEATSGDEAEAAAAEESSESEEEDEDDEEGEDDDSSEDDGEDSDDEEAEEESEEEEEEEEPPPAAAPAAKKARR